MSIIRRKGVRRRDIQLADAETSRVVGELARDVDEINDRSTELLVKYVKNTAYTEPMRLFLPYNPDFILCGRIVRTFDPESAPVLGGGMVEYFWRTSRQGSYAEIVSIDGMTPSDVRYSFKFLIVGRHDPEQF
jgi:hypothetical protein